jgi:hypothetical protein
MFSLPARLFQKISARHITLLSIVSVAYFFRVHELYSDFFFPETHSIFNGLRLHLLDLFNFWDHISDNFFKSFFGGISGIRFPLSTYISSTIYGWLGIPLNEFWLIFFYVCLGVFCVIGTYLIGCSLSDYRSGLAGAAILALNTEAIRRCSFEGAQPTVTFVVLLIILILINYKQNPTWFHRTALSILLAIMVSMESMAAVPLIFLYQLMLFVAPETSYSRKIIGCFRYLRSKENILIWLPACITLALHYYIYIRVGMSKIGLFAYTISKSNRSLTNVDVFNSPFWNIQTYDYYFNPTFFFSSMAIFCFLFIIRKRNNLSKSLIFSGTGFFYYSVLFFLSGGSFAQEFIFTTLNTLFLGTIWISFFDVIVEKFKSTRFGPNTSFSLYAGLSLFFMIQTLGVLQEVMNRQHLTHTLKSTGYYIHEYGGDNPSAFLLLPCITYNIVASSEFYFGTQIMDQEEAYGAPRKLYCMGTKSKDEILAAYKLKDFDFYVGVYSYSALRVGENRSPYHNLRTPKTDSLRRDLLAEGVKRVAIIRNKGTIWGEIFSRHNLPFKDMEIDEYDPLWDQKFANIPGIVKTKWTGQAGTWGPLFSSETGIQNDR